LFSIVILGDVLPRVAAARRSESFALAAIVPINMLSLALAPLRWTIHNALRAIFSAAHQPDLQPAPFVLDDEFEAVFERVHPRSVIEEDEGEMIRGVLSYGEVMLREILIPRPDIVGLSEDVPARDAIEFYRANEYSRMPVYRENLDQVTGVLYAKDLLPLAARNELDRPVKSIARKPYYVPATMTVDQFIKECQQLRTHLAIVVDEFGGTEGIVTLEDAMEVVVGDIEDEGDEAPPTYEELGNRAYRIDGAMDLEQVGQLLGVPIEDGEHETLGGFVMAGVGKIPEAGDSIKHNGVVFTIERVEGKRIASIRARIQQLPEELAAS
jgi:CBS domain containing-hemolysin-like protein